MTAGALVAKSSRAHRIEGGVNFYFNMQSIPFRKCGTGFVLELHAQTAKQRRRRSSALRPTMGASEEQSTPLLAQTYPHGASI